MFNLLPEQEKKKIHRQYKIRRAIVILAFFLVIVIAGSVFLIPSYVLTSFREKEAEERLDQVTTALANKNRSELNQKLSEINKKIASVTIENTDYAFYDLLDKVLDVRPPGVSITAISLQDRSGKDDNYIRIQLSGVAVTRDRLVEYRDILSDSDIYRLVDLPVGSLAEDRNADFIINLELAI